jgi:actin related protein 2/3 complex, subunit 3
MMFADQEDIIDETLHYFRANVLFRNFEVKGSADRTMIYLTLFACQLLVRAEKIEDKNAGIFNQATPFILNKDDDMSWLAVREFRNLAVKPFAIPGDATWALGGLFSMPQSKAEAGNYFMPQYFTIKIRLTFRRRFLQSIFQTSS